MESKTDGWTWLLGGLAGVTAAVSLWILIDPEGWFEVFPGVAETGPFNVHFVRDVGCANLMIAAVLGWAALVRTHRAVLIMVTAIWFGLHALLHVFDTMRGHLHTDHMIPDFAAIYAPAILTLGVAIWMFRRDARAAEPAEPTN